MARCFIRAEPPDVLQALTDPQFISLWAPVDFDAEVKLGRETGLNARVLRAATGALLSGGALDRALGCLARELDDVALLAA